MPNWDDVARIALALPGTTEAVSASGRRRWLVRGRTFLRDRSLHRTDLVELGADAPSGPVLVASVPDAGSEGGAARRRAGRLLHDVARRRPAGGALPARPAGRRIPDRARRRGLGRPCPAPLVTEHAEV